MSSGWESEVATEALMSKNSIFILVLINLVLLSAYVAVNHSEYPIRSLLSSKYSVESTLFIHHSFITKLMVFRRNCNHHFDFGVSWVIFFKIVIAEGAEVPLQYIFILSVAGVTLPAWILVSIIAGCANLRNPFLGHEPRKL